MSQRQMEVLLVEDNAADQRLVLKALQKIDTSLYIKPIFEAWPIKGIPGLPVRPADSLALVNA